MLWQCWMAELKILYKLLLNFLYKGCCYAAFSYFSPMIRSFFLITFLFCFVSMQAQEDSSHLRISLLTCGTGDGVEETFGHNAVRVVDSALGTDLAFNYGTFEFDDDFAIKFARGKLL